MYSSLCRAMGEWLYYYNKVTINEIKTNKKSCFFIYIAYKFFPPYVFQQDVIPLFAALQNHYNFFRDRNMHMFSSLSIAGLSLQYALLTQNTDCSKNMLYKFDDKHADVDDRLRYNLVGGPRFVRCSYYV